MSAMGRKRTFDIIRSPGRSAEHLTPQLSRSFSSKQFIKLKLVKFHPGRPAMIALAAVRRDFHFPEQRVHFGDRQRAAGADAAVTSHGRGDMVQAFLEAERLIEG